jgi:hypothetical protein
LSALVGGLIASVGAAVTFCFSSDTSVRARQDVLDATFKMGMVPVLKGVVRENAISVRVQHAEARTHRRGSCPDARVDVQAPNVGTRPSSIVDVPGSAKTNIPKKNQAGNEQSIELGD